ncbi:hypothetical protein [Acinetobacter sp. YK3]|uniref:hypothetical protein n=1 Tax=Acinetobacter sp. YK3 TaxID=1860097 RepID=UPI00084BF54C|nr:hypothetical protein [Acinetobacter sp. YK3]OEC91993.1 hypothetical protein A9Z07_15770 [Acinetobacter sp. YK3]
MNSEQKFGEALAFNVVQYLIKRKQISNYHKEYCGTGFYVDGQNIFYTHFFDGYPDLEHYQNSENRYSGIISIFHEIAEFQDWLANQSDKKLSGAESQDDFYSYNQRITKLKLEKLILESQKLDN